MHAVHPSVIQYIKDTIHSNKTATNSTELVLG